MPQYNVRHSQSIWFEFSATPRILLKAEKEEVVRREKLWTLQNMVKLAGLQILRVIACVGVFLCHLGAQMEVEGTVEKLMDFGARGVYLFFILSGFFGFQSKELERENKKQGCIRYWTKRAFKILPLYYALIIYNFVLYEFILRSTPPDSSGIGWPRYFFFLSASIPSDKNFWVNLCSTWTISIFGVVYLLVPLMKRYVVSFKGSVLLWAALYLLSFFCLGKVPYGMPFFYLHYFVMGIVFYYAEEEGRVRELIIGCVAFVLGSVAVNHTLTHSACSMLFLIVIIMAKEFKVENVRAKKWIDKLDEYSYTIYLMHAIVMDGIEMIKNRYPISQMTILLIGIGCTIIGCFVAHKLIEVPMEKVGKKCLERMKK